MPSALVIGGRGQCGRAVATHLVREGWSVTATTHGAVADADDIVWHHTDAEHLDLVAASGEFDAVVDTVAFTRKHAEELASLGDRVGSAVVLSSISVYADENGRSLDEARDEESFPTLPVPVSESQRTVSPTGETYSRRKVALEERLREIAPFPVTILRPGAIYGSPTRHLREWYFVQRVLDGRRRVVLPYDGASRFHPTSVVNLATFVAAALATPAHRTLNCADANAPTVAEIGATVDEIMGTVTERVLVAGPPPAPHVGDHPWMAVHPIVADLSRATSELGVSPEPYGAGLAAAIEWAVAACEGKDWREVLTVLASYAGEAFDYEAEDAVLADRDRSRGL